LVIPSGVAFFLALFVPAVIFGMPEPGWYLGVVFLAFMASAVGPIPYFAKKRRAYLESGGDILNQCRVCDAKIPDQRMWAHMDSEHPGEARRLKVLRVLVYGSLLAIYIGFTAILWGALVGIFPFEWGAQAPTFVIVSLLAWAAVFLPWVALVERPHRVKVRGEWQATHFAAPTRPR
jgi:hypothetical protein